MRHREDDAECEQWADGAQAVAREDGERQESDRGKRERSREEGPLFSSPRTSLIMAWRPLAPYTAPSGRSARSGGRRPLFFFGLERADAWTQVLEHEREPDRGEQDGQEDDDRRRLLSSRGHGG